MLLEIDEQSEQPIYQQLIDQIIVGIAKGELVPNESLPSIRQLADEIGVNMMTVSKAYNKLKQSGYIVTDRRNGTKIAAKLPATAVWQQQLHERLELLLAESFLHQQSEAEATFPVAKSTEKTGTLFTAPCTDSPEALIPFFTTPRCKAFCLLLFKKS